MRDKVTSKIVNSFIKMSGEKVNQYNVYFREDGYNYVIINVSENNAIKIVNALNRCDISNTQINMKLAKLHTSIELDKVNPIDK